MLIVGVLLAAVFVFRLQPPFVPQQAPTLGPQKGVATLLMPAGVGSDTTLNFSPANATIVVGVNNTVVWVNQDTSPHTVVSKAIPSGAASFSSPILAKGGEFNVTLTVPGTYRYFCSLHPAWMQAVVVVKAAQATTPAPHPGVVVTMVPGLGADNMLNYAPSTIRVVLGVNNTVTWVNRDASIHTVTATDKTFDSGNIMPGSSFTFRFTAPGTYSYICIYHGWMKGTVVVRQGG